MDHGGGGNEDVYSFGEVGVEKARESDFTAEKEKEERTTCKLLCSSYSTKTLNLQHHRFDGRKQVSRVNDHSHPTTGRHP